MDKLLQNALYYTNSIAAHLRSFFTFSAAQLLWGLGIAALLLPVAVYAWRLQFHGSVTSSVMSDDQSSQSKMMPRAEQPDPAKVEVELHADQEGGTSLPDDVSSEPARNNTQTDTEVHINGEQVPLPPDGTVHREISSENSNTSIDISVQSDSSGSSRSHSNTSMDIKLKSETKSESDDGG